MTASRGDRIGAQLDRLAAGTTISPEERAEREQAVADMEASWRGYDERARDLLGRRAWNEEARPDDPLLMLHISLDALDKEEYAWLRTELVGQSARVFIAEGSTSGDVRHVADITRGETCLVRMSRLFDEVADKVAQLSEPGTPLPVWPFSITHKPATTAASQWGVFTQASGGGSHWARRQPEPSTQRVAG